MSKYEHAESIVSDCEDTLISLKADLTMLQDRRDSVSNQITDKMDRIEQISTTISLLSVHAPSEEHKES